ncbi:hypothetical protein FH608_040290 [Nonomuraea phyllanthi]|uniref:Uncharacterized protein n=1 Tax=Nonomuraea phyllanthi TaxID=2219224 RepID=A0A5C4VM26_9ACTN|nr:hypothetical protein [Nonomuraea phyllanthi]KAB8189428.1 hypothetical protein FH608_040290 [Nonomuraea phyllanthi]
MIGMPIAGALPAVATVTAAAHSASEQPVHAYVLAENTSRTERAKILAVFISNTGDDLRVDDPRP